MKLTNSCQPKGLLSLIANTTQSAMHYNVTSPSPTDSYLYIKAVYFLVVLAIVVHLLQIAGSLRPKVTDEQWWYDDMVSAIGVGSSNLDERNKHGLAPLHVALSAGWPNVARKLVERGASLDCPTAEGAHTPLHYAAANGRCMRGHDEELETTRLLGRGADLADLAELLLSRGADPNSRDQRGNRPLHLVAATADPNLRTLRSLLERGVHVDARNDYGRTPLMHAIAWRNDECARELLARGASVDEEWITTGGMLDTMVDWAEAFEFDAFREHWMRLRAAGLSPFGEWDEAQIVAICEPFYERCLLEVEDLKRTYVDARTSLYRLLHTNPNDRGAYVNNEKLKELVDSPTLRERFPIYYVLILGSYHEAVARKSLMEPTKAAWYGATKIYLPDICLECIFKYVGNADMLELIGIYERLSTLPTAEQVD